MNTLELITCSPTSPISDTPLLFIHGAWHGAWCWDEKFLPYFAQQGYTAHAVSLRGHGQSTPTPIRWVSYKEYIADVITIAQQLPSPPIVIGHSMGGYTVQKYLETQFAPAAVLFAAPSPRLALIPVFNLLRLAPIALIKSIFARDLYPLVSTPELARKLLFSTNMPLTEVATYQNHLTSESFRIFADIVFLNPPKPELIKTAVFVLGGADDVLVPPSEIEYTARVYNAQATILPDIAHDMMLEANWQTAADAIITWLQQQNIS